MPGPAGSRRGGLGPAVVLAALALSAVVLSRIVLRSDHELAALAAGWLPGFVIGLIGAGIIARLVMVARRRALLALSWVELAVMCWVLCACIGAHSPLRAPFWIYALLPYLTLGGVFVLAARFADRATVRWVLAATGAIVAASVILDAVGLAVVSPQRRPGGLLGNRNFAGEYLALALPAALVVFTSTRRWLVVLVLFGLALALTRCRTAWIAASLAAPAVVLLSSPAARGSRALGAAMVLAGVLLAGVVPTRLAWSEPHPLAATLSRAVDLERGSGALRVRQYIVTMRVLDARGAWWTGVGAGGWQAAARTEDRALARNRIPHSDYLRTLSDGGLPALAALCVALLAAAATAWRMRGQHPDALVFIGVLALTAVADAPLFRPEVAVAAAAVLATCRAGPRWLAASADSSLRGRSGVGGAVAGERVGTSSEPATGELEACVHVGHIGWRASGSDRGS